VVGDDDVTQFVNREVNLQGKNIEDALISNEDTVGCRRESDISGYNESATPSARCLTAMTHYTPSVGHVNNFICPCRTKRHQCVRWLDTHICLSHTDHTDKDTDGT